MTRSGQPCRVDAGTVGNAFSGPDQLALELELALEYIEDDELVEVTPKAIRLRKVYPKENDRKRSARHAQ